MTYFPKNKIKTDLYSNGELILKSTNKPYTGFYHRLFNGGIFTGKNQYDKPNLELIEVIQTSEPPEGNTILEFDYKTLNLMNYNYSAIKKLNKSSLEKQEIKNITTYPTDKEYQDGIFTRYFVVKINENIFTEINKELFTDLKSKNAKYNWELFIPFKLLWDINGDVINSYKTNKNIVELTEFRLKRNGLGKYLNFDFLKYFKYETKLDLYTNGGELVDMRENDYKGSYHIDEYKGYRMGKNQKESNQNKLIPKKILEI